MNDKKPIREGDLIALLENNAVRSISHVIPVNDLIEHIEAIDCQCKVSLYIHEEDVLIRHTPLDQRDMVEKANEVLGNAGNNDPKKGWETILIVIPVLCQCNECQEERDAGPNLDLIHSVLNLLCNKCEHILSEEEIEEVKNAQYHINVFTGINNDSVH